MSQSRPLLLALALCAAHAGLTSTPAAAQDADLSLLQRAVQTTAPRSVIRVQLRDERLLSGPLLAADANGIELSSSGGAAVRVSYADVSRYWERGRAVRGGAVTLGLIGAGFGAAVGALLASTCETCSSDHSAADGALQGGLVVGGLGVVVGGILGAAIPRWRLRWEDRASSDDVAPVVVAVAQSSEAPRSTGGIGELTLQLAGGHGRVELDPSLTQPHEFSAGEGVMLGVLATLSFRAGRFGLGPELLYMKGTPDVKALSGLIHLDLGGRDGRVAPYVLAGLGGYDWGDEVLLTVPLGLGVSLGADHRWRTEVRWHELVHNGSFTRPSLLTISAGRRLAW